MGSMVNNMPVTNFTPVPGAIVQHLRIFMEALADAVAAELAHHGKAIGLRVLLDGVTDIAQRGPF